ncbi:TraV family lipoprotein [Shewanella aestuarii]|uniref:TraV family lipoprotein n=1 Tax=Shewanella aestuarii TaxID=1028752 RepID=A0A6G9QPC5_9GAMM|nr:TraV family lipoprotein [Shewanella aestuarii]QIR16450.1 TraV family lipoprotein [Shewanella aestuarii]
MKKLAVAISITLSTLSMTGCSMMQVGEDEFSCPNQGLGAACSSARQIHDLTNNRDNLEGLNISNGKITSHIDSNGEVHDVSGSNTNVVIADAHSNEPKGAEDYSLIEQPFDYHNKEAVKPTVPNLADNGRAVNDVYQPIDSKRYDTLPAAQSVPEPQNRTFGAVQGLNDEHGKLMVHRQAPMALAPEPLAVLQQPKTMRILVASWTDEAGDLNMPGFVYVEVEPKKWIVGDQANKRPGRIVPLQIQQKTQEEERRQSKSKSGYSSLGITER